MEQLRLRRDDVAWSDLGSEIVILDLRCSLYFSVRDSAAFLLTELIGGSSAPALVDRLIGTYDVTEDIARTDVDDFLAQLRRRDLLESVDG